MSLFEKVTPESVGISTVKVYDFIEKLKKHKMPMHSIIMASGSKIFAEMYWKPFNKNSLHRMYSQTKSYVSIAVGELAAEGKIDLDDKIVTYFPDKLPEKVHPYLEMMTIRDMLTMQTCMDGNDWFVSGTDDRLKYYFRCIPHRIPGTTFCYDSNASFVLSALVERVSGKMFMEYMREKFLDEIGFSENATCLKAPGGHSWGDSALLCTSRDMLKFGRLVANKGEWNGKQLLNRDYVTEAASKLVDNEVYNIRNHEQQGYGYQIWHCYNGSFAFIGMHGQFTIYHPETDILFVCTAGVPIANIHHEIIIDSFFEYITDYIGEPMADNSVHNRMLEDYCSNLVLYSVDGATNAEFEKEISGRIFKVEENPMGITRFRLNFGEEYGEFCYTNSQGEKTLKFGKNKNAFGKFPQTGYSDTIGSYQCEGHMYDCAVSAAWKENRKLSICVQIIDNYIGSLDITISFKNNYAVIDMKKSAENFLEEYSGYANAALIQ